MMAKALDINGAKKVYIVGRRLEKLQEVASAAVGSPLPPNTRLISEKRIELRSLQVNKSIVAVQGDITSKESLASITEKVKSEVGFVNVVIANSGISGP